MAAVSTAVIAGGSLALGAYKTAKGASEKNKFEDKLNNYDRQKLNNRAEDLKINTAAADLMTEESARTTNAMIGAVSKGGSRAITSNVGRIQGSNTKANQRAALNIDRQVQRRNNAIVRENARIERMHENREISDMQGLGAGIEAGRQTMWSGMSDMQNSLNFAANNGMFDSLGGGGSGDSDDGDSDSED